MDRNRFEQNRPSSSSSSHIGRDSREPRSYNENSRRDQYPRRNHSPEWKNFYSQRPPAQHGSHYHNQDSSYRMRSDNRHPHSQSQQPRSDYQRSQRRSRSRERNSQPRSSHSASTNSSTNESRHRENIKKTERQQLLEKWRKDFCTTGEDMKRKLEELEDEVVSWIRSSPADIYYSRVQDKIVKSTTRLDTLCNLFENLIERSEKVRSEQIPYNASNMRKKKVRPCRHSGKT